MTDYKEFVKSFENTIKRGLFQSLSKGTNNQIIISESDYSVKFGVPKNIGDGLSFRLEEIKGKANYLNGDPKRGAGKDNDLTIILNNCIYQFEIKSARTKNNMKNIDKGTAVKQIKGGLCWLQHILWLADEDYNNLFNDIYYIVVTLPRSEERTSRPRTSLTVPYKIQYNNDNKENAYYLMEIANPKVTIDLTMLFRSTTESHKVDFGTVKITKK